MSSVRKVVSCFLSLALVAGAILAVANRQQIIDEITLWQYQPSEQITTIASRAKMSETGKKMFYISKPQIKSANEFNEDCRRVEKGNAILGCYNQSSGEIYVYDVTNPELDGVKEVTAAHEMLHAAWARLGSAEKKQLTLLLEQAYEKVKTDKLAERMEYYNRAQPGSRANELHSILGTEFANLGDELERYYKRYFTDRSEILRLHAQYQEKFESREKEARELSESLKTRKEDLDQELAQYSADVADFNRRASDFNQRANSGNFSSQDDFARQRRSLQAELSGLNRRRASLNAQVDSYNSDVLRLRQLGVKINELNKSLDSVEGAK
jgi:hypothetical protein